MDEVRAVHYDVSIDAQGLFKTALLPYLAGVKRRIGFLDISRVVGETLNADAVQGSNGYAADLGTVLGTDARARVLAEEICQRVGL